ncbi:hypothetical protein BBP40_006947 [Aspergillus hancockii]|nr:hypothetical protein BBP40_006947 [Aspergillus hancockii]
MDTGHRNLLRICQRKLDEEASHPDRDLRLLVGHANVFNALLSVPIALSPSPPGQQEEPPWMQPEAELKAPPGELSIKSTSLIAVEQLDFKSYLVPIHATVLEHPIGNYNP